MKLQYSDEGNIYLTKSHTKIHDVTYRTTINLIETIWIQIKPVTSSYHPAIMCILSIPVLLINCKLQCYIRHKHFFEIILFAVSYISALICHITF